MEQHLPHVVLLQKLLRIVVAVDVDLSDSVKHRWVLTSGLNTGFQPREDQLQSVPLFDFMNEFIDREIASDGSQQSFDGRFITVDVKETTDDLRGADGVDSLNVYLYELCEPVLIQIEDKIVDEVEAVADDDKRQLIGKFGLLQEILDLLRIVVVALSADPLDLPNLTCASGCLNVLEMYLGIFAKVDDRAKIVVQPYQRLSDDHKGRKDDLSYLRNS
jgi:hypothetical protein